MPCYTYNFKCAVSIRLNCRCIFPYDLVMSYAITLSEPLRVAHSGTSKLKTVPNLQKHWPVPPAPNKGHLVAHEWISIVPSLHTRSYIPFKYQRLGLQSVATLTSQSKVEYRWNTGPAVQFVLISGVPCYTYNFKCPVSIRVNLHVCIPMWCSYPAVQLRGPNHCGTLTVGLQSWRLFQICKTLTRAARPE